MLLKEITNEHIEKFDPLILVKSLDNLVSFSMDFLLLFIQKYEDNKIKTPKYKFTQEIELNKEQQEIFKFKNKTTIGRVIYNAFCLPKEYFENFPFVDDTITAGLNSSIHTNLALLLTENKIDAKTYSDCVDRMTWLGMNLTNYRGICMDFDSINMSDSFIKHKNKVYAELKAKNASGNEILSEEDKLIDMAVNEKRNTGLVKIIKAGIKGSMTNNYKVLNIGRGLVKNGAGELKLLHNSLVEGNQSSDYVELSNNSILGSYGRSMKTAQGGYLTKLVSSGFSYLNINKSIEDCGSNKFLKVKITASNFKEYINRNIRVSGTSKWISLTLNNYKDFIGKNCEMRSPMYCHSTNGICPMCFGNLYKLNKVDTGLSVIITDLTSKIMNTSMKSFHDLTVKYYTIDISDYF